MIVKELRDTLRKNMFRTQAGLNYTGTCTPRNELDARHSGSGRSISNMERMRAYKGSLIRPHHAAQRAVETQH